jgi:hypothetical protein
MKKKNYLQNPNQFINISYDQRAIELSSEQANVNVKSQQYTCYWKTENVVLLTDEGIIEHPA